MIVINNEKAIEIVKEKIRAIREPKFKKLDLDFQKALETGSDTTLIVQEKQRLRDLTDLANSKTVEELLVILEELDVIMANGKIRFGNNQVDN